MHRKVSAIKSAETVSALRAAAAKEKDPAVQCGDYLAKYFLGLKNTILVTLLPGPLTKRLLQFLSPGSYCFAIVRTKHFDKVLRDEIKKDIKQVVILGAGYDSRAFRFADELKNISVFEIDFPGTQRYKLGRLKKAFLNLPENISFIECDFNNQSLEQALAEKEFSLHKKTIFLWEGVSYYMPERVVHKTLSYVNSCAKGSSIVFDYATRDFVNGDYSSYGGKQIARWLRKINEPFLFGMNADHTSMYLRANGLNVATDYSPQQLEEMYLQTSAGKILGKTLGHVRMVHAMVS